MAIAIGTATPERLGEALPERTSRQPRFGAIDTTPSLRRTTPTMATPTPIRRRRGRPAPTAGAGREVGDDLIDREWPRGPIHTVHVEDLASQPDDRRGQRVDCDLERKDDGAARVEVHERRRPARACPADGRLLGDEAGRGQLADEAADRAARQARRGRPSSERESGPRSCSSRTIALRFARRTVSLRCPRPRARRHRVCVPFFQSCDRLYHEPADVKAVACRGRPEDRPEDGVQASEMTELRWGILSTADIAREKVIPGIQQARRCEVVAIASRDAAPRPSVADELGIPTAHGSYEALLADPDVDAVYIPLPNHLHAEWTIAAARAGKHVLCEKPLAMTPADAERMIDACRGARASG